MREHYLDLLDNFQKGKIKAFDFCKSFKDTFMIIADFPDVLESNLIILSPNEESLSFANLIEEIFDECEAYLEMLHFDDHVFISRDYDYDIELQKHEMNLRENEFYLKKFVKETYVKIQNCLKEE